ncbi:hypothetical protein SEUBUCD646_0D01390 [Saccharomyces eubayanus]|nr:hypothetical protein SEUBUCD646_0D01390 [Saccharomyces eubayanus]
MDAHDFERSLPLP